MRLHVKEGRSGVELLLAPGSPADAEPPGDTKRK
jgi:hypothetical protein